jgi:hypothetical protein
MRLTIFTFLFALLTTAAMAVAPHKSVIISYPNDTPQSVVDEAMAKIEKDGGKITHKYSEYSDFMHVIWSAGKEKRYTFPQVEAGASESADVDLLPDRDT